MSASGSKRRKGRPTLSGEVLQSLLENGKSPLSDQFLRWKLWAKWAEVVGPTMAAQTVPVGYARGVLFIWVKHSAWMQQLIFLRDQVKDKINDFLSVPYVKMVRFTMDRREVPSIEDPDLKHTLAQLMGTDD
jgi:predicted nucleic acid-binding Zn ribbon protein